MTLGRDSHLDGFAYADMVGVSGDARQGRMGDLRTLSDL